MKKLYIVRHAKAEFPSFSKDDYHRDLIGKGKEKAHQIASALRDFVDIDEKTLFISSSANRAIQTATLFAEVLEYSGSIQQEKSIYEAHYSNILSVINKVSDETNTLFIFGHNPGLSNLTAYLSNDFVDLKTAHTAYLEIEDVSFQELSGNTASLKKVFQE